eukprot:g4013.t1
MFFPRIRNVLHLRKRPLHRLQYQLFSSITTTNDNSNQIINILQQSSTNTSRSSSNDQQPLSLLDPEEVRSLIGPLTQASDIYEHAVSVSAIQGDESQRQVALHLEDIVSEVLLREALITETLANQPTDAEVGSSPPLLDLSACDLRLSFSFVHGYEGSGKTLIRDLLDLCLVLRENKEVDGGGTMAPTGRTNKTDTNNGGDESLQRNGTKSSTNTVAETMGSTTDTSVTSVVNETRHYTIAKVTLFEMMENIRSRIANQLRVEGIEDGEFYLDCLDASLNDYLSELRNSAVKETYQTSGGVDSKTEQREHPIDPQHGLPIYSGQGNHVIFLIEDFAVTDLTHAVLLRRTIVSLIQRGCIVFALSNQPLAKLGIGLVAKEKFQPTIDMLEAYASYTLGVWSMSYYHKKYGMK